MVRQARGSTGDGQQRSGSSRVSNEAGTQDTRYRGSWETYTKALITGLAIP
ncbi:unnamed protein product [Staurois parvus]|uniref:Uncharacterized protein n=1 Tax=Staurois parvus TaxID=386267 RepID=A0ABN9FR37_9NEOB|nr:unnamed protein product [Staurois parvus]